MKIVYISSLKSNSLSEFQAYKLIENTPKSQFFKPKSWELFRTKDWILYQKNRKQKTKENFKIRRLCALLSKKYNQNVRYYQNSNVIIVNIGNHKNIAYIIADMVNSKEEYEYHLNKYKEKFAYVNMKVISLTNSDFCSYFKIDKITIKKYYENEFEFPEWFKPFLKMRAYRGMCIDGRFIFADGRLNDTSKSTAKEKLNKYLGKSGKIYFTLSRCLDSKLDRDGRGFMLNNLIYAAIDVDGDCMQNYHIINEQGICQNCWIDANKKLKRLLSKKIKGFEIEKILFSGLKGFHIHFSLNGKREITEEEMTETIRKINKGKQIVDEFKGKNGNGFDVFRIFKLPNSISAETACIVKELPIKRLDVKDKLM